MRAMILAAGRGLRMGALTLDTPKPLLKVNNQYLIEYAILNLVRAGIYEIVINVSYLGEKIQAVIGDGKKYGAQIQYSVEKEILETGGGIVKALPLLGNEPFIVMSADIITNYPFEQLSASVSHAHLILVDNPSFHPKGDFGLTNGFVDKTANPKLTFANIGVYHPSLFSQCEVHHFRIFDLLTPLILQQKITGEHFHGKWHNVGSPEELELARSS